MANIDCKGEVDLWPFRGKKKWMGSDKGVGPRRISQALSGQDVEASHGDFEEESG